MKKLLYSAMALFVAGALFTGCGDKTTGGGGTETPKPSIEFQTNTGTFAGYTFANDKKVIGSAIKIGVKLTSTINLKSTKMTVKYNNQAEQIIGTDSLFSGSVTSAKRDYTFVLPQDKGTYTFTAYAVNKDATVSTAKIEIIAFGPLADRGTGLVFSLKATTPGDYSAFDLFEGTPITAASGAGNDASRDIVDASTSSTLSRTWKSGTGNGTQFVISGVDGKLNSKVYTQFASEQDVIDAWNATAGKSTTVTGIDDGKLIIAKATRGTATYYYLIAIDTVTDDVGADADTYTFQYKQ
jgi:hypothetical protein